MSTEAATSQLIWRPSEQRVQQAQITRYQHWLKREHGLSFADYESMWQWSVDELPAFWTSIWDYFEVSAHRPYQQVLARDEMPGAQWFTGAQLNFSEHLLRRAQQADAHETSAIVFGNEQGQTELISWDDLRSTTGALMHELRSLDVQPGERVVSYMPNIPQTAAALLAATGLGAIWSSCSPDMGAVGVLDRFRQIDPVVMFAVDGYRYGGKDYDRRDQVRQMVAQLPSLRAVIFVPSLDPDNELSLSPGASPVAVRSWQDAVTNKPSQAPVFEPVPFDHPLWIVYSSGTTGMPKPIVHGHGGVLLEMFKSSLHLDVGPNDRFFWLTSTSWIVWNLWIGNLAVGATVLQFDGNPGHPDLTTPWRFAQDHGATFFGTSPAFVGMNMKAGLQPGRQFDLRSIRTIGSTGSPLTEDAYRWLYAEVHDDFLLASISGGTDPAAAFLTSSPTLPVYAGQMQCRALGCAVAAYDEQGSDVMDELGELVVTQPMPSMPLQFWGDTSGERYRSSYFEPWPGVWRHGDWLRLIRQPESVTSIIYGRSDSTINRRGIRMGTSELYRVVENIDWVMDSLVVDLEYLGKPSHLLLFVVLREQESEPSISQARRDQIKQAIAEQLSARHVPNTIEAIAQVPRTLSGKKLEVPIKRILLGHDPAKVLNRDSMANPDAVEWFLQYARQAASS